MASNYDFFIKRKEEREKREKELRRLLKKDYEEIVEFADQVDAIVFPHEHEISVNLREPELLDKERNA